MPTKTPLPVRAQAAWNAYLKRRMKALGAAWRVSRPGLTRDLRGRPWCRLGGEAPAQGRGGWVGVEAVAFERADHERLRDAIDTPFASGAREVRTAYLKKRMRE